jgi:hypothetical protein
MGLNMIPKEKRAPDWKKRRKKLAVSIYQPWKTRDVAAFFGEKIMTFHSACVSEFCLSLRKFETLILEKKFISNLLL